MKNSKSITRTMAVALGAVLLASAAQADLETSDAGYTGPFIDLASRVDLCACGVPSGQGQIDANYGYTFGPVDLPGMVFTRSQGDTNSGLGAVLGQGEYGLTGNGGFGAGAVFAGLDGWSGHMDFTLTGGPVSEFGAYVNYAIGGAGEGEEVGGNPFIAALGADGSVLETWDLSVLAPVSTPGGFNQFTFRGISRDSADIYGLRFGNAYIIAAGTASGALPTVTPVPEPSTYALMLIGLGAVVLATRQRRRAAEASPTVA